MNWRIVLVLAFSLLSACASQPVEREGDPKKSAGLNAELGLRYMLQGQNELALEKLKKSLEQDPTSAIAHHYLAELYRRLEEHDDADRHFRRAIELDPQNSSAYNNYGVFLCSRKRYADAEAQFLTVLKNPVYTGRAHTLENLGLCWRDAGELSKAEDYFRRALLVDPRLPQSLYAMAEITYKADKSLSARGYLQRYSEVAAHTPQSLWLGIRIERELGDKSTVASYGMLLKNNFPDTPEAGLYLSTERR